MLGRCCQKDCNNSIWILKSWLIELVYWNRAKECQSDLVVDLCLLFFPETESRESGYESGILVSKAVDLDIDGTKLKPAGELLNQVTHALQMVVKAYILLQCIFYCLTLFYLIKNIRNYIFCNKVNKWLYMLYCY